MRKRMKSHRFQEYLKKQKALFEEYGDELRHLRRQGQKEEEQKILGWKYHTPFDSDTYGSAENYQQFIVDVEQIGSYQAMKKLWCKRHHNDYKMPYAEFYQICPDRCPITGALLDFGEGFNRATKHPMHRPGQDHIHAQNNGGAKKGDISNLQIINQRMNTIKNDGTLIDALQWTMHEVKSIE